MIERVKLKKDDLEIDEKMNGNDSEISVFFSNVIRRNAIMVAHWMFHGLYVIYNV